MLFPLSHDLSTNFILSESTEASATIGDIVFPAHEPVRPVFCCTSVKAKDVEYACKPGNSISTLQRGRMCNFRDYIAEYSLSKGIPVNENLTWPEGAGYLVKVVQYQQKGESQSLDISHNRSLKHLSTTPLVPKNMQS